MQARPHCLYSIMVTRTPVLCLSLSFKLLQVLGKRLLGKDVSMFLDSREPQMSTHVCCCVYLFIDVRRTSYASSPCFSFLFQQIQLFLCFLHFSKTTKSAFSHQRMPNQRDDAYDVRRIPCRVRMLCILITTHLIR